MLVHVYFVGPLEVQCDAIFVARADSGPCDPFPPLPETTSTGRLRAADYRGHVPRPGEYGRVDQLCKSRVFSFSFTEFGGKAYTPSIVYQARVCLSRSLQPRGQGSDLSVRLDCVQLPSLYGSCYCPGPYHAGALSTCPCDYSLRFRRTVHVVSAHTGHCAVRWFANSSVLAELVDSAPCRACLRRRSSSPVRAACDMSASWRSAPSVLLGFYPAEVVKGSLFAHSFVAIHLDCCADPGAALLTISGALC
jgi:hypothetical protein